MFKVAMKTFEFFVPNFEKDFLSISLEKFIHSIYNKFDSLSE